MFWRGSNGSVDAHLFRERGHELHEALRAGARHDHGVEGRLGPHDRANQLGIEVVRFGRFRNEIVVGTVGADRPEVVHRDRYVRLQRRRLRPARCGSWPARPPRAAACEGPARRRSPRRRPGLARVPIASLLVRGARRRVGLRTRYRSAARRTRARPASVPPDVRACKTVPQRLPSRSTGVFSCAGATCLFVRPRRSRDWSAVLDGKETGPRGADVA